MSPYRKTDFTEIGTPQMFFSRSFSWQNKDFRCGFMDSLILQNAANLLSFSHSATSFQSKIGHYTVFEQKLGRFRIETDPKSNPTCATKRVELPFQNCASMDKIG